MNLWCVVIFYHLNSFWFTYFFLDLNSDSYLDVAFGPGTPGMGGANGSHHQRTKRMRTSFKHHQLRTMKSYFAINHNPDAKDLKQLSQKTGLPKRVLQVSFSVHYKKIISLLCISKSSVLLCTVHQTYGTVSSDSVQAGSKF